MASGYVLAMLGVTLGCGEAIACTPPPDIERSLPKSIAERGVLIEGRVIRAFDAATRTSEIIEADRILIGTVGQRRFQIYRDPVEFEQVARGITTTCDHRLTRVDQQSRLFALIPTPVRDSRYPEGKWFLNPFGFLATEGDGLETALDIAGRVGRLRSRRTRRAN